MDPRHLFKLYDNDHSDSISPTELGEHLGKLMLGVLNKAQLRYLTRLFDEDGDGKIDVYEFAHFAFDIKLLMIALMTNLA